MFAALILVVYGSVVLFVFKQKYTKAEGKGVCEGALANACGTE